MAGNADAGPNQTNGLATSDHAKRSSMNPYETDPQRIPKDDAYISRSPYYGRYAPRDGDFRPRYDRWYQSEPEESAYWEETVRKFWVAENCLNVPGTREAFAIGSVVVRVDQESVDDASVESYSCANANELSSGRKVEDALKEVGVSVPVIYFYGVIDGKNVTVESRIPGVSLEVAWKYLTAGQIASIKNQCRYIVQRLAAIDRASDGPSYVCGGLNSLLPPDVPEQEKKILFQEKGESETLCLVHNDMVRSNIVVKDDRVVGIANWRQCGFFGIDRVAKVHRAFRLPEISYIGDSTDTAEGAQSWVDLYSDPSETSMSTGSREASEPPVKTEPTAMNLDKLPTSEDVETKSVLGQLDGTDPTDEHPTPKKIANLKHGLASRASSSDRSSPANSVKGATTGKKSVGGTKKGTAKKPVAMKRKANDQDGDSIDGGRRSNTPSSHASKTPAPKKQGSASVTGSPAPEPKRKGSKPVPKKKTDDDDDDGVFCICRKPDNHTWMIGCDGECDDWYHGKCVKIDTKDADLIDKYICKCFCAGVAIQSLTFPTGPNCHEKGLGHTSWKPMCRLPECRKPARPSRKAPSKYCCDDHGREFMRRKTQHFDLGSRPTSRRGDRDAKTPDDIGSRGGILTAGELKAAIMGVSSVDEFRRLGERIVPPPEEEPPDERPETETQPPKPKKEKKLGLDVDAKGLTYTPNEAAKLDKLRKRRDELLHRQEMLQVRDTFVGLVRQRSKNILDRLKQTDPKGGWKDICGFDSRVAWSDEEFDEWRLSAAGEKSLKDNTLDAPAPPPPSQTNGNGSTDADGDIVMNGNGEEDENDVESLSRGVCIKKRCERHKQWVKVQQEDILFEQNTAQQDLKKCEEEAQTVVERAVLRMWAEMDNAHVGGD